MRRIIQDKNRKRASMGGSARMALLTPEQRSELGRKARAMGYGRLTPEERSEAARKSQKSRKWDREERRKAGYLGHLKRWGFQPPKTLNDILIAWVTK